MGKWGWGWSWGPTPRGFLFKVFIVYWSIATDDTVTVSGGRQRASARRALVPVLPQTPSHAGLFPSRLCCTKKSKQGAARRTGVSVPLTSGQVVAL